MSKYLIKLLLALVTLSLIIMGCNSNKFDKTKAREQMLESYYEEIARNTVNGGTSKLPKNGIVRDEETARKIAEVAIYSSYGSLTSEQNKPYIARYFDKYKVWIVTGKLMSESGAPLIGKLPVVVIQKSDGRILSIFTEK